MNTAIIVAAGSSTRFGGARPKQFVPILGKPLLIHTLEKFDASPIIDNIVLVLSEDGKEIFLRLQQQFPIRKVLFIETGGVTRAESVWRGLAAAPGDIDVIHDGARPLVTLDEIERTVEAAKATGAACLVATVTDTIKQTRGDVITGTVDRVSLRRAMTPQAFRYPILMQAFDGADLGDEVTDECYLVEKLGVPITMVQGSPWNIKVTLPDDILVAEALLARQNQ
jgi:2-C-methyl-D-erythritol 4-phosphate cytidylyltransferase